MQLPRIRRSALVLLGIATACGPGGPRRVGSEPSWRHAGDGKTATATAVGPVTFAPTSEPARNYNEPLRAPPHTPLGDAVAAAVKKAAERDHQPPPVADARLFRACNEIAEVASEDGVDYSILEFALQHNGIIEPQPQVLLVSGDVDAIQAVLDQLEPQFSKLREGVNLRFGVGAAKRHPDGTGIIVFAVQASGVTTTPIPRALPEGGAVTLDAVVDAHYREPEVFVTHDDGTTERLTLDLGQAGAFKTPLSCNRHHGRQQVEITATDASGSAVLANFPVWCGTEPPVSLVIQPKDEHEEIMPPAEAEQRLFELMNRDRKTAGLPAFQWDGRVAAVARKYSEEMRTTKVVAHVSPISGSVADRLAAAKIKSAVMLENVARAYGVGQAHTGLMNSPGHRANLMSSAATHVGVGVVEGDVSADHHELYVTEVFIRVPPKLDRASGAERIAKLFQGARQVGVDAQLSAIAQSVAEGLAAGQTRDALWPTARKRLDAMPGRFARVGSLITAVADLDGLDGKELLGHEKPDDIGVGVAQGPHPEIGDNAVWIVVLMAERPHK
jgi:uncharacterized protein YkwD